MTIYNKNGTAKELGRYIVYYICSSCSRSTLSAYFIQENVISIWIELNHSALLLRFNKHTNGRAHNILVLMAYEQIPHIPTHTEVSSEDRGPLVVLSLYLYAYFVYANSEVSGKLVGMHVQTHISLHFWQIQYLQNIYAHRHCSKMHTPNSL